MLRYRLSPYVSFIQSRLIPGIIQHGVFHRLSGVVLEPGEGIRGLLHAASTGTFISLDQENLTSFGPEGAQLKQVLERQFLVPIDSDPLHSFMNQFVVRPMQNPALMYRRSNGEASLVYTTMANRVYSPGKDQLPEVIEESVPNLSAQIFELADGKKRLSEIMNLVQGQDTDHVLTSQCVREAIDFLTAPERQLVKFARELDALNNPVEPFNCVPRNFYHSSRWDAASRPEISEPIRDFHLHGIDDSGWEFDQIEPTVNHAFRFPSEVLGGFDYGSRFCQVTLCDEVLPRLRNLDTLRVLEVGGGTGTFARSFIQQAQQPNPPALPVKLDYHILDLSPVLMDCQKKLLGDLLPTANHFHQDATQFNIPNGSFDLIIANEVIADFPVAKVHRSDHSSSAHSRALTGKQLIGSGADYLRKLKLDEENLPDHFFVNAGAFSFIERAWQHLSPGGTLIVTEYGAEHRYPAQSFHLNHEEYSIHFDHLQRCAADVGFNCRLLGLNDFLKVDEQVLILNGRDERIRCLNHILGKRGISLPYRVISKNEFDVQFREIVDDMGVTGLSFAPLYQAFHYGPRIDDFMALILKKPLS